MAVVVGGLGSWEDAWWCMLVCPVAGLAIAFGILTVEQKRDAALAEWRQLAALNRRRQKNFKTGLY
jgi:hypothetical protein